MSLSVLLAGLATFFNAELAVNVAYGFLGNLVYDGVMNPIGGLRGKWNKIRISNHDLEKALNGAYKRALRAIALGLGGSWWRSTFRADELIREFADAFGSNFLTPFLEDSKRPKLSADQVERLRERAWDYSALLTEKAGDVLGMNPVLPYNTIDELLSAAFGAGQSSVAAITAQRATAAAELMQRVSDALREAEPSETRDQFCQLLAYAPEDKTGVQPPLLLGAIIYFFQEELKANERVSAIMTHLDLRSLRQELASQKDDLTRQLDDIKQALAEATARGDPAEIAGYADQEVLRRTELSAAVEQLERFPSAEESFKALDAGMHRHDRTFKEFTKRVEQQLNDIERGIGEIIDYTKRDIERQERFPRWFKTYGGIGLAIVVVEVAVFLTYRYLDQWVKIPIWALVIFMLLTAALISLIYLAVHAGKSQLTRSPSG